MTDVAIVGGGPAGLMLAIELGVRGIACTVFDENDGPPKLPKANATSARTMEHFRRRGFAHAIRAQGLPSDHPQDVVYTTRLASYELARFRIPSSGEAATRASFGDYREAAWPTPELPHRVQQMYVERVLRGEVARYASVTCRYGERVDAVSEDPDGVTLESHDVASGVTATSRARYMVGCDGPRSLVRSAMGASYGGEGGVRREFMGGNMATLFFRSRAFMTVLRKPRAWMYWSVNAEQRSIAVAVDGRELFGLAIQLRPEQSLDDLDVDRVFAAAVGAPFHYELIARTPWSAGLALVADRFARGRLLIAGDAAHLFTPTGGMGYNTSIDDAVNLGWKLGAVIDGTAPRSLLDTYDAERRPIAIRNTRFAARMADSIGRMPVSATIDEATDEGSAERATLGNALASHVAAEFNIPGLQLGVRYVSSILAEDGSTPPTDEPDRYEPSGYPGARAPHALVDGRPLFDRFGRDFTLLITDDDEASHWPRIAGERRLKLDVVRVRDPDIRELYGGDRILIRPDHHVAWRGSDAPPDQVLARALGA